GRMTRRIWYEDIVAGQRMAAPPRRVTPADIDRFAHLTGRRYRVDMDHDGVSTLAGFQDRIARGLSTLAPIGEPTPRPGRLGTGVAAPGELRFPAPPSSGDAAHPRRQFASCRPAGTAGRGLAIGRGQRLEADGPLAVPGRHALLLCSRPNHESPYVAGRTRTLRPGSGAGPLMRALLRLLSAVPTLFGVV